MNKVLMIDVVHPCMTTELEKLDYQVVDGTFFSKKEILKELSNYVGIVIRSKFTVDKEVIDAAKTLKWIARSGSGLENIDVTYAKSKSIEIFNSPEGNRNAVGEHVVGMLLSLFNHLKRGDTEVRQGLWNREKNRGLELEGKTVGIIGYGQMGSSVAKCLSGFNCNIIAYDKYKTGFGNDFVTEVTLEELQQQTDILSIHIPYNEETHYLLNKAFLNSFNKNLWVVNTSRGKCLNTADLIELLDSGKAIGACLDVLEYELASFEELNAETLPQPFQELVKRDNVLLSPHVAGWTVESYKKLALVLVDKVRKFNSL